MFFNKKKKCVRISVHAFDDGSLLISGYNAKGEKIIYTTPQKDCEMKFGDMRVVIANNKIIKIQ